MDLIWIYVCIVVKTGNFVIFFIFDDIVIFHATIRFIATNLSKIKTLKTGCT